MKRNCIKFIFMVCAILLPLISCTTKEETKINVIQENQSIKISKNSTNNKENDNDKNHSIEVVLKRISQKEYDNWVLKSYEGCSMRDGEPLPLPDIEKFYYPYIEGIENRELKSKINETIKDAIFNEEFFLYPMLAVSVATTPWSKFEFPGIIISNDVLSIPITLFWNREKSHYKSMSVTIDMKTGERLFLEDIIELNEEFANNLIYKEEFFINISLGGKEIKESIYGISYADKETPSEASKWLLEILRGYEPEDEKPKVELFYLTKDGIVLTHFSDGIPFEINIPLKNLQEYLKINSWK